ncbi:acetyl-coenzyme A synthetase, partial [Candidatus Gracilibacteria bacterium]
CALVGIPDELTGEALFGFVVLKDKKNISNKDLLQKLNISLRKEIGPIVSLKNILITSELPKTRSGKIVRRVLRNLAKGKEIEGDLSTVENKEILGIIKEKIKNFN